MQIDEAGRILAMLIEATGFEHCEKEAKDFHNFLLKAPFSTHAFTYILMNIVKINGGKRTSGDSIDLVSLESNNTIVITKSNRGVSN